MVIGAVGLETVPTPCAFTAATVNVYVSPLMSPVITCAVDDVANVTVAAGTPFTDATIWEPVIGEPPSVAGGRHRTVTRSDPGRALGASGANGVVDVSVVAGCTGRSIGGRGGLAEVEVVDEVAEDRPRSRARRARVGPAVGRGSRRWPPRKSSSMNFRYASKLSVWWST